MTDRLLGKRDMAAMLGTSPGVAALFWRNDHAFISTFFAHQRTERCPWLA